MRTIAPVVLVSLCTLCAQELAHDTAPHIISKVEAEYSDEGRLARLEGTSILRVTVGADGTARDPQVVQYLGLGLDEKAVEAVSKWKFAPGTKDGQPVESQAQIEVNFRLIDKTRWRVQRVDQLTSNTSQQFNIEGVVNPRVADDAPSATATLTFYIDKEGTPFEIRVEKSSDDEWARAVTEAVGNWQFTPAKEDRPFAARFTMDFVRGGYIP